MIWFCIFRFSSYMLFCISLNLTNWNNQFNVMFVWSVWFKKHTYRVFIPLFFINFKATIIK